MRVLHLFAGAGGSHLCGEILGWQSVGSVEIEPYCQAVIRHHYPSENIHDDIKTFSATELLGRVDGICGGFPCQDISSAGKGAGITGERSGLWKEFARIIGECRPAWAFIENSPLLRTRGLEVVLEDLAALGYDAEWATYRASDVGAPHRRDRMWILAYAGQIRPLGEPIGDTGSVGSKGCQEKSGERSESSILPETCCSDVAYSSEMFRNGGCVNGCQVSQPGNGCVPAIMANTNQAQDQGICKQSSGVPSSLADANGAGGWWASDPADDAESQVGRVVDGMADPLLRWNRVHALAALGNGWVPQQAAEAFRQLWARAMTP